MPDKRSTLILWLILGGGAFLFFIVCLIALAAYVSDRPGGSLGLGSNQVAVIDLEGVIGDSKEFIEQLKSYGTHSGVRAVVLRLNSPGGSVAPSQEMYEAVKKFRA